MKLMEKIYLKIFVSSGFPYALYLKKRGIFYKQGEQCFISMAANFPDPYLLSLGNNVWLTAGCSLLCHDASVIMINQGRGGHLDAVGPIIIGDNCFLGNNTIVLPNVTIGKNTIVGAGSVVTKSIPDNTVWAGNPASQITDFKTYCEKIEKRNEVYPWASMLKINDQHVFDPKQEPILRIKRANYFFEGRGGQCQTN